ncbi:MAG TPA: SHOCT domain-containing protein [Acidimicrobiales bacterium]|jgi:membrane protease subunit (stomatin/prohibitin family)|nr:SHOCT domain-containing protein [Acidimicrobiales bacterium]
MRTVGRTAVIAGTATVVAGGVNRHQQQKAAAQQNEAAQQAAAAAPPPAPEAAAPSSDDLINKLKELANLKDQGILTEAEFSDQKAKILAEMS